MATPISVANFQAACGEVYDAIESSSWTSAWKWYAKAEAQNAGLEEQVGDSGAYIRRRDTLAGLKTAITMAQQAANADGSQSRFIKTQTSHKAK